MGVLYFRNNLQDRQRMIYFEVMNPSQKGKKIPFRDDLTIGNAKTCKVRVHRDDMQDVHAIFFQENGKFIIEAGNDLAHILINGRDVIRAELKHNDEIVVGPLHLRVIDADLMKEQTSRLDNLIASLDNNLDDDDVYDFSKEDLFYLVAKDPSLRKAISFTIPSKEKFIDQAQVFLTRLVKNSGMVESQVDAFMTCTKELILNAHRHGHRFDESKTITCTYRDLGDRLTLTISDEGSGFDHRTVLAAVRGKNAAQAARERYQAGGIGGLGFQMVSRMAKDLTYNDAGNRVSFAVMKTD